MKIKRIISVLVIVIVIALSIMVTRTLFTRFPTITEWTHDASITDIPYDFDSHIARLSKGLQIPTISRMDTDQINYTEFAKFRDHIEQQYPMIFQNMDYHLIDSNAVLLIWKGSNPEKDPILFNAHYDVVPAEDWAEAFSGEIRDGRIYGRGSIDMKGMLFALLGGVEELIRDGFRPQRDIYFAFGHDEETHQTASKNIAAHLKEKNLTFDAIYDEGGMINMMNINGREYGFAFVGIAEKGYLTARIKVFADGGHSSMPNRHSAMGDAAKIIHRLESNQMPAQISPATHDMLKNFGTAHGFMMKAMIANIDILKPLVLEALASDPGVNAAIRTTTAITGAKGSDAENVIPEMVQIVANFRLAPGDKMEDVLKHIETQTTGFNTQIEIGKVRDASNISKTDTHGFKAMMEAIKYVFPDAIVVPYTTLGGTDSRNYQELSNNIYRFLPAALTASERDLMHAKDENISSDNYAKMILFFKSLMKNYDD